MRSMFDVSKSYSESLAEVERYWMPICTSSTPDGGKWLDCHDCTACFKSFLLSDSPCPSAFLLHFPLSLSPFSLLPFPQALSYVVSS